MSAPYLTVKELTHAYGDVPLFSALSFGLAQGVVMQVTGTNGSGKTTLLQLLAGLKSCQEGSVTWRDETPRLYIGHQNAIKVELSPLENLSLYQADSGRCAQALDAMGLGVSHHNCPCYMLSAGQQRKVALSRLMLSETKVWLLDEPFTALDEASRLRVSGYLEQHAKQGGSAIVATHEPLGIDAAVFCELVMA